MAFILENLGLTLLLVLLGGFFMPFYHSSPIFCRSSHLFALFDKVISFCTIFDFVNKNKPI